MVPKLIETCLIQYFDKFNLLCPDQFGFRSRFLTELSLNSSTDTPKRAIHMGHIVGTIFADFTKAFHTINHTILLHKLDVIVIYGPPLSLIRNYLTNRSHVVEINGCLSQHKILIKCGPQGSILGQLIFLVYIMILRIFLSLQIAYYMLIILLYLVQTCLTEVLYLLSSYLDNLMSWCKLNQLYIHPAKTHFMLLQNVVIHTSPAVLFLVVLIDTYLKLHQLIK